MTQNQQIFEYEYESSAGSGRWARNRVPKGTTLEDVLSHITRECANHPEKLRRYRVIETNVIVHVPKLKVSI